MRTIIVILALLLLYIDS